MPAEYTLLIFALLSGREGIHMDALFVCPISLRFGILTHILLFVHKIYG